MSRINSQKPIYLDYNASTPIDKEVTETMLPYLTTYFGNLSSSHSHGTELKKAIAHVRQQIATSINFEPEEIPELFPKGFTEVKPYLRLTPLPNI